MADFIRNAGPAIAAAETALERLRLGNERFREGRLLHRHESAHWRNHLVEGQQPFATILGCADSRIPPELIFDQGFGDLFVIRVAGNIVAASQIGSVEFAAERFHTPLVVVLGHSRCGAVLATLEELMRPRETQSRNLRAIVDRVRPSVEALLATELRHDEEALVRHAVRANVSVSAAHLRHGSEILEQRIQRRELQVVGAEYSLETGAVDFFDGVPESRQGPREAGR
jgi:carbonic anhydrase